MRLMFVIDFDVKFRKTYEWGLLGNVSQNQETQVKYIELFKKNETKKTLYIFQLISTVQCSPVDSLKYINRENIYN